MRLLTSPLQSEVCESGERLDICAPFYCFGERRLLQGKPGKDCQAKAMRMISEPTKPGKNRTKKQPSVSWCQPFIFWSSGMSRGSWNNLQYMIRGDTSHLGHSNTFHKSLAIEAGGTGLS